MVKDDKKIRANVSQEKVYHLFGIPIFSNVVYSDCISIVQNGLNKVIDD